MIRRYLPGACALALLATPALADAVPKLDIEKTCKSANQANVSISASASEEGCLRSEREAMKEAERRWDEYKPAAKAQCRSQFKAGGYPSYVEMVTCLELASGAVPAQTNGGGSAVGGPGSPGGKAAAKATGDLTQEPSPRQRTNPIDVLNKK